MSQKDILITRDASIRRLELRMNELKKYEIIKYLNGEFVPKFNNKFTIDYQKFPSVFETSSSKKSQLYSCCPNHRKIDNSNTIKFQNKCYQTYLNNELKYFIPKTEYLVIQSFNGDLLVIIDENIYELRELSRKE